MGTMAESAAMVHVQAQAKVSADVRRRVAEVLEREGITVDEAFEQMLTRTAADGALALEAEGGRGTVGDEDPGHDAWFRAEVRKGMEDTNPGIPHEAMEKEWAKERAELLKRAS
jgi:antitoxin component of RelBE/YafQ-DinJ toxin-antitoxin module